MSNPKQPVHTEEKPNDAPSGGGASPGGEIGGRGGLEPTRYGDWEINGRCVDF